MKAVTLLSGGLDSTTLAYELRRQYPDIELTALSFDYGQRHKKELKVARDIARRQKWEHHIVKLGVSTHEGTFTEPLARLITGSALTDESVAVPEGHYAWETMKQTVVPNRNAIMLSIAYGVAVARNAELVAFAAHAGDHAIYPDCRPDFVEALNGALAIGNEWAEPVPKIVGPFLFSTKGEIAIKAHQLNVPIALTWSCYKGGDTHCGVCGTCYERREALAEAQRVLGEFFSDPTPYVDSTTEFAAP